MSGGGTIYTDLGGWQFTFIEHSDQTQIDFSQYIGPVVDAVRELGADAGFNGRNDLLIGGRKFSGNAQYRLPGCIVHHGSLLYDTDLAQMAAATTVDPYKIQSKSIKSVRDRVTNISEHLPRKLPAEQFKACMLRHLMRGSTQTYCLTPADDARIRALAEEKFVAWDAVYGRNPRFNIERTGHFAGGKFTFRLDVQRGVICQARSTASPRKTWPASLQTERPRRSYIVAGRGPFLSISAPPGSRARRRSGARRSRRRWPGWSRGA